MGEPGVSSERVIRCQDPGLDRLRDEIDDVARLAPGQFGEDVDEEIVAAHRGGLQHANAPRRQPAQPPRDDFLDRGRHRDPRIGCGMGRQEMGQLLHEQGMTAAAAGHITRPAGSDLLSGKLPYEQLHLGRLEPGEADVLGGP